MLPIALTRKPIGQANSAITKNAIPRISIKEKRVSLFNLDVSVNKMFKRMKFKRMKECQKTRPDPLIFYDNNLLLTTHSA